MNAQLNAAKKADPLESHVDELRERLPPGAVIIVSNAGHDPWLEAPNQFGAALRAEVERQTQTAS